MKIVILHDNPPARGFAGATISTYELALGLREVGHQVFVITTCRSDSEAGDYDYKGIKVYQIVSNYPARWRAYRSIYNPSVVRQVETLLARIRPEVVHAHNIHFHLSYRCLKVARRYARRVIFTARDVMPFNFGKLRTRAYLEKGDYRTSWRDQLQQAGKRWNPFRNFLIRYYLACVHQIVAVSEALKIALEQNGITNVAVIHTGISLESTPISPGVIRQFRERYELKDRPVVLFAGRLSEAKGSHQMMEAMIGVVAKTDALLLVAGETGRTGITDRVVYTGWLGPDEMKVAFTVADLVVVPSICFDSFPRVVLEAMAASKPVVGTCYGGAPEIIVDGVTGYIVNPFNVQKLTEKMIDLLEDSGKAKRFGAAGRTRVREYFNLKQKVNDYQNLYQKNN